jgi:hypothetical protein
VENEYFSAKRFAEKRSIEMKKFASLVCLVAGVALTQMECIPQSSSVTPVAEDILVCVLPDVANAIRQKICGIDPIPALAEKVEWCLEQLVVKRIFGAVPSSCASVTGTK